MKRFVRSVRQRTNTYEERAVEKGIIEEQEKPMSNARPTARDLQQVRTLVRDADRAFAQGRAEEAERCLIQALTIIPGECSVQAQLAKHYLETGSLQKSEALYREILQEVDDVSFHANLGLAYYKQGKFNEACASYKEALTRDPKTPERAAALGRACIAAKRFDEAAPLLEKASERMARDTELLHLLADCYVRLGHREQAQEAYMRINKLQPYDQDVKEKLAALAR